MSKIAVLVMGAPRSGTSAVSHLMSEMGVYFGKPTHFVDPVEHTHNPIFFELHSLNQFNDRVLKELGHVYGQFEYFPEVDEPKIDMYPGFTELATKLVEEELESRPLIGLKDPRFVFTLPLWDKVLQGLGYSVKIIVTQRSVDDVVRSNQEVNKGSSETYNRRVALVSIGLTAARIAGRDHLAVDYDDLVESPEDQARRIAGWLELDEKVVHGASEVIRTELRHHGSKRNESEKEIIHSVNAQADEYSDFMNMMERYGIFELLDTRRIWIAAALSGQESGGAPEMLQDGVERLLNAVDSHSKQLEALAESLDSRNVSVDRLSKKRDEASADLEASLRERISKLEHEILEREKLSAVLEESLRERINALEINAQKRDELFIVLEESFRERINTLQIEAKKREDITSELKESLRARINDLELELKGMKAANVNLEDSAAELESTLRRRIQELEAIALERARAFAKISSELNVALGDAHRLDTQFWRMAEQAKDRENRILAIKREHEHTLAELNHSLSRIEALNAEADELRKEVSKLMPLRKKVAWYYRTHGSAALLKRALLGKRPNLSVQTNVIGEPGAYESLSQPEKQTGTEAIESDNMIPGQAHESLAEVSNSPIEEAKSSHTLIEQRFGSIQPLPVVSTSGTEVRVNLVTDSINKGSLFGGVGTAIILFALLAKKINAKMRIVTRTESPDRDGFYQVLACNGIDLDNEVEFEHVGVGDSHVRLPICEGDRFLTTSWWTTACVLGSIPPSRVDYLLQEDERMFYPQGDDRLRCREVLERDDIRYVINTELLYCHLINSGLNHFKKCARWFEPAFPKVMFHDDDKNNSCYIKRLFFYARPNNLRNLFYRGIEVLDAAVSQDLINPDEWEIVMVGKDVPTLTLGGTMQPKILSTMGWKAYGEFIRSVDIGFCLMDTPHPSYPPLDLAASGAVVLTNKFGMKDDLHKYSDNIICADLGINSLLDGLRECITRLKDNKARMKAYETNKISRSWPDSMAGVIKFLGNK